MRARAAAAALLAALAAAPCRSRAAAGAAHPVAVRLDAVYERLESAMPPVVWGRAIEARVDAVALSTESAAPGAREALDARLREGRYLAAAVLWKLDRDDRALTPLMSVLENESRSGDPGPALDEIVFVLRYARYRPAVPVLWRRIARLGSGSPYAKVECAAAIFGIDGDARALDLIRSIAQGADDGFQGADVTPSRLAEAYLKDIPAEPKAAASKSKEGAR